ncbi:RND transporter [bacterium]|nr:RND transporter [bacterium]
MESQFPRVGRALALFVGVAVLVAGCGKLADTGAKDTGPGRTVAKNDGNTDKDAEGDHSGWWCDEHGLPEEVCDLCSKRFRTAEKAKGNWCEHNRVKSSCFKCNPGLQEKYAAEYKAKFGKNPPPIKG